MMLWRSVTLNGPFGLVGGVCTTMPLPGAPAKTVVWRARTQADRNRAAATDNIGLFFGEDIFVAIGSILLITGFVDTSYHLQLEPLQIALWAIPTAVCAFVIHGFRMLRFDKRLDAMAGQRPERQHAEGNV